jgi:hypothetical protein
METAQRDSEDGAPSRPRQVTKGKIGLLLLGCAILGTVALAGVGAVILVVVWSAGSKAGHSSDERPEPAKSEGRFVGKWEGSSPERPSVIVYLEVTPDRVILQGQNIKTKASASPLVYSWSVVRVSGNNLVISHQELMGEKRDIQWSIQFTSDNDMSVTSLADNRLIANFKRTAK